MILYLHGTHKPYVMSVDVEYDREKLLQVGAIMLKHLGNGLYQTCRSFNAYINHETISQFVQDYTNITANFLHEYGVSLEEAQKSWKEFIVDVDSDDLLVVSHGIHQDSIILKDNGFSVDEYEHWCTYNMSKWVLERDNCLTLSDLLKEYGIIPVAEHNAYADSLTTLLLFSVLLKLDSEEK